MRIVFALGMLLARPFSVVCWGCYLCAGASDLLDGIVARALNTQSAAGARLDSIADAVFACAIAVFVVLHIPLPVWMWYGTAGIAVLRFTAYGIGLHKFHTFSSLHTYANKATGALIFAFPLLYRVLALPAAGGLLLAVAFVSSVEEIIIIAKSKELNWDCKSLLLQ